VKRILLIAAAVPLIAAPLYLLKRPSGGSAADPVKVLSRYLKASYARDYQQAYRFIAAKDRQLKPEKVYVHERGAFTGFTLIAARKLAESISVQAAQITAEGDRTKIRASLKLPDAESVAPLLFDWDEEKLNSLPSTEQRKLLDSLEQLSRSGTMKMIEGEEEFTLVKEDAGWRMALDWHAGLRVSFDATVPDNSPIEAEPDPSETVVQSSEPFRIAYRVRNRSDKALRTRIVHKVEPEEVRPYLDIVECALLLPVTINAGQQEEFSTTYLVRGDLPESARHFKITYEFKVDS
jgi:hypothetical protein